MAVAALVLGILGTLCSLTVVGMLPGVLLSILALVLGIVGRKQAVNESRPTGMATAGLVLGIVGTAVSVLIFLACAAFIGTANKLAREAERQDQKQHQERVRQAALPPAALGSPVTFVNDSTWTVTDAKERGTTLTSAATRATTAGHFVQVTFKISNLTMRPYLVRELPVIVDGQGRELTPYDRSANFLPPGAQDLATTTLIPSRENELVEIYDLPADAHELKFQARALATPLGESRLADTRLVDLGM